MPGGRSIQLMRVFGIRVGVDPSWFLVLFLFIWWLSTWYEELYPGDDTKAFALATAGALLFFLSVVLHELGHAVVAMRNGIGIAGIDLWLFGGLARMKSDTRTPGQEFRIAAAGPAVTLVIAVLCYGLGSLFFAGEVADGVTFDEDSGISAGAALLGWLTLINVCLLVFNLIPAYPLDGGRIARAFAWWRTGDRERATRLVARIGRGFGWFLIAFGAFTLLNGDTIGGVWTIAIGFMLSQAAKGAELQTRISEHLGDLTVRDVMDPEPVSLLAQTKLDRALDEFFLRYRWPWFPVVDATGRFLGLVSRQKVEEVPEALREGSSVDQVMLLDETKSLRVDVDEPIEALLGSEALQQLGAVMAVDSDGVLRGVVTVDRVRRALNPSPQAP
ncbi:MAG: site-2 protease family protein [Actinomycetota bacterium]|nr:site-2 protease family protein [Actinomycetota bacterium]